MRVLLALSSLVALANASAFAGPPPAGDEAPPGDTAPFGEPPPGWSADPGIVARVRPAHLGSRRYLIDALPVIDVHYGDVVQLSLDDGAKLKLLGNKTWAIGPVAEYRQSFTDDLPRGARDVDDAIEVGGFASVRLPFGELEGRLRKALTGYEGWSGDLSLDAGAPIGAKWTIGGEFRVAWADSSFSNEYFGLRPRAAVRENLPRFLENDFWTVGAQLGAARRINKKMELVAQLSEDRMISGLGHTPLLSTRNLASFTLGVVYHWSPH